jgi:hypothetical protein
MPHCQFLVFGWGVVSWRPLNMFSLFSCSGGRLSFPKVEINPPSLSLSRSFSESISSGFSCQPSVCVSHWARCVSICHPGVTLASRRRHGIKAKTIAPVQPWRHNLSINITENIQRKSPNLYSNLISALMTFIFKRKITE